ncbi:phage tail tape measure protein [Rhodococcus koreensis]
MALDVGELVARLTVDDSRFTRSLQQSEQRLQNLGTTARTEAGRVDTALRDAGQSADRLGTNAQGAARNLGRVGDSARDLGRVDSTARQAAGSVDQLGNNARRAAQETSRIGEGVRERLTGAFEGVGELAGRTGDSGGGNFLASFSTKIGSLGSKGGPIAASLVGVAAVGLAAGVVLANAIADGMQQEADANLIQAKLGVDDATMRKIGAASGEAFSHGWGESATANMDAARAAIQSGLLTGNEDAGTIQKTIEQLNIVSSLMGEEIPAVARAAGKSVQNGIAKDATGAFDLLAASQKGSLNVSEDLLESQVEYSTQLRALGLEGVEGWALVSQGVKAGARDTDVVIDALKEFKLRVTDGTAAGADGFDKLGVNAEEAQKAMAEGGTAARDMTAKLLNGLHEIKDPQDRYNAALALFGTKFEDIQGAVDKMDLDTAAQQFGKVAGEAQRAGDTMSKGTAAAFTEAKNSISVSADQIELALARAFGPALKEGAQWVTEHKPEIIGFFTGLADAGFATLDAMMAFSSGALRAWAFFAEGVGGTIGTVVQQMAGLVDAQASVLDLIPGMSGQADDFRGIADGMRGFADSVGTAGDKARSMADTIDKGRPIIQGMRDSVAEAGAQAQASAVLMQALGKTVVEEIPDDKSITISDNSPETIKNLEALGLKVENTPNGITVTAKTDDAQRILDGFIAQQRSLTVDVYPTIQAARAARGVPADFVGPVGMAVQQNADGGIHEPGQANIRQGQGRGIYQWAEGETGWEAFIPGAPSKRAQSEKILAETAKRFGLGLVKPMADGGITGGFDGAAATAYAKSHAGEPYVYGALDCSGFLSGVFNAGTGQSVRFVTGSDFASMGWAPGYDPNGFSIGTNGGVGENGHMAGSLFGTNIESDGSNGIQYGGGADGPLDFPEVWHWPGAGGGNDPSTEDVNNAVKNALGGPGAVTGTTDSGVTLSTDGQRVFVTNWPGGSSSSTGTPAPDAKSDTIFSAAIKYRANGGIDNLPGQAGIQHGTVYRYGEPETGGEAFIPLGASKRPRSVALTKQVANRFGYDLVPMADGGLGGFGGYTGNTDKPSLDIPLTAGGLAGMTANQRRAALYNLGAIGVGGAFAVASGFDENGNFTGQFDTGANSHPALEKGAGVLFEKMDELIAAAREGKSVKVQVDVDNGSGMANLAITKTGL